MNKETCILLIGPTAAGKSSLLYENFSDFPFHVISADSMQIYREFNVGSATPGRQQLDIFPHTGINARDPDENYNVADFLTCADAAVDKATARGLIPLLIGGTGLYIKTFLYGLDDMPAANRAYRSRLRDLIDQKGKKYLHDRLKKIDSRAAEKIHPNDLRRVIRALEIYYQTGKTKTELTSGKSEIRKKIEPVIFGIKRPRGELIQRVNRRVECMVEEGLVEEVKKIRENWEPGRTIRQAIGYKEVVQYLEGKMDYREMIDKISNNTVEFLRKQMNWFQRFPVKEWYHPEEDKRELIEEVERNL